MNAVRGRQAIQLLPFVPRVGRWAVVPATAGMAAVMLGIAALFADWGAGAAATTLRLGAVALAGAVGFALDDPAAVTVAASPLPLRARRSLAAVGVLAASAVAWLLLLGTAGGLLDDAGTACLTLMRGGLSWEAGWLFATVVLTAVVAGRRSGVTGGTAASAAVILVYLAAHQLPARWSVLPGSPLDPMWASGHRHLMVITAVVAVVALLAMADPWRRGGRGTAAASGVMVVAVAAVVLLSARPAAALDSRLDATLDDLVAAQGITQLKVVVQSPDGTWSRTVGEAPEQQEVGLLLLTKTGRPYASTARTVVGATSTDDLDRWTRGLAAEDGDLDDQVSAAGAPPGTAWAEPDPRAPRPVATTEVRWAPDRDLVITVMTGDRAAPCGTAVADALLAQILA